ncbi:MAG: tetratricopeptide repeat protein [Woeseia sp.]
MNIRLFISTGLIASLAINMASAQTYPSFPGQVTDRQTLRTQERVEELFDSGAYERAFFIYRNELAPRGDKYAQYMVGYMHLTGTGVREDPVIALAWYRLAAERGEPSVAQARDSLAEALSPAQIAAANVLFADLRSKFSDRALLLKLVRRDMDILRKSLTGGSSPGAASMIVIDRRYGVDSGAHYYEMVRKRLNRRLSYLKGHVEVVDVEGDPHATELVEIESEIKKLISEIDDRQ